MQHRAPAPAEATAPGTSSTHFALSVDTVRERYRAFTAAFPGAEVAFAVKSNPHPAVLATLAAEGASFELASANEVEALGGLAVPDERLIYGTAVKPVDHMVRAFSAGVRRYAADSERELTQLAIACPAASVHLRAKVDDSSSVFSMSGKFGAQLHELPRLARRTVELGLDFAGLSFNVGSQASSADAWSEAITALAPVLEELHGMGLDVRQLDLGGGYPVAYGRAGVPTATDVARAVDAALSGVSHRPGQLVLEPGRALVAESTTLDCLVTARVERGGRTWLFLDVGAYNGLFEALSIQGSTRYPVSLAGRESDAGAGRFSLAGPTGDGLDVLGHDVLLPQDVGEGDRLQLQDVGAYTFAMSSPFNGFPVPPVHVLDRLGDRAGVLTAVA